MAGARPAGRRGGWYGLQEAQVADGGAFVFGQYAVGIGRPPGRLVVAVVLRPHLAAATTIRFRREGWPAQRRRNGTRTSCGAGPHNPRGRAAGAPVAPGSRFAFPVAVIRRFPSGVQEFTAAGGSAGRNRGRTRA